MAKVNTNHIPFLTGEVCSTAGVSIDQELSEQYSDEIISLAIQLKANNLRGAGGERENNAKKPLQEASDTFFIEYAKRMLQKQFKAKIYETYHKRANNCPINDPQWAIYSADEILAMEKNGYVIPDDIVAWAHSQQQLDVTNYVLTTDSDSEDSTVEDTFANTDSLDVLQATAKKNIEKAEKAAETVKEKQDKYNTIAEKAAQLRKNKEEEFERTVKEVKSLTEEWENLKNKKDSNGLSNNEQQKFTEISKQLKNNQTGNKQNLNSGKNEIDEFLGELDGLNIEITNTNQVAKDTIYSGRTLNTITKNYNVYNLPYAYTGTSFDNSGLISMPLTGMTNEDIGELAVQKGEELDTSNDIAADEANGGNYTETIEFATKFTDYVEENKDNVNEIKNENEVDSTENEQNQNNEVSTEENGETTATNNDNENNNTENNNGKPAIEYGIKESLDAAGKSVNSAATDIDKTTTVNTDNKSLNKELKTAKREMTVINKQVDNLNEKLSGNEKDTETFLQELERLQAENPDDSVQISAQASTQETQDEEKTENNTNEQQPIEENTIVKNGQNEFEKSTESANTILNAFEVADNILAENKTQNLQTETTNPEDAAEEAKKAENRSKKIEIAQNIQDLGADRTDISSELETAIESGDRATQKGIKTLTTLNKSNNELTVQNDKTKEDSSISTDTGVGTYALGMMDKFNGIATFSYGVLLASNPFTFTQGIFMQGVGAALQGKGNLEMISGTIAVTAGTAGKGTSAVANTAIGSALSTMTEAQSILNVNILNINNATDEASKAEENQQAAPAENNQTEPAEANNSAISNAIAQNAPADGAENIDTANEVSDNSLIAGAIDNTVTSEQVQQPVQETPAIATGFAANATETAQPAIENDTEKTENTLENIENNTADINNENAETPVENNTEINEPEENNNTEKNTEQVNNNEDKIENQTENTNQTEEINEISDNEETKTQNAEQNTDEVNFENAENVENITDETTETTDNTEETENTAKNSTLTQIEENKPENLADLGKIEVTINENEKTSQEKTKTEENKENAKNVQNEQKEVTEKDANKAAKESKTLKTEVEAGKKEDQKSQKDIKKISKEIKDINKKTKKDEEKFKKEINQEQKQIEQKNKEIEQKSQQIQKKQEEQAELQVDIEALNAAFSSTTAAKQTEIQTNIQTKSGALTGKNSEIAETAAQLGVLKIANTKKFHTLNRSIQQYTGIAKRSLKTANNANKTSDKILKIADTTSQIAGLASIAGNITSRIGNAVTAAGNAQIVGGNIQISTGTPLLSNPFTASAGAALVASGTSMVVAGTGQVATGTTTSIIGESVSLAANITNAAANATKAVVYAEQGNIAGAIMSTGAAIMSGVSAGQNISQLGQLNQMADSATAVSSAAQQASTQATEATNAVSNGAAGSTQLAQTSTSIQTSMSEAMNGVTDTAGNVVSKGFNASQTAFSKAAKFGLDDLMQVGGALQTAGSMLGSDKNGSAEDVQKDRKLRRFGTISRINSKKKLQKVNAVSTNSYNSKRGTSN